MDLLKEANNTISLNRHDIYDDSWAVIIGIDKYKYSDQLNYAVKDAEAVKEMLISKFDYPEENIRYLTDDEAYVLNKSYGLTGKKLSAKQIAAGEIPEGMIPEAKLEEVDMDPEMYESEAIQLAERKGIDPELVKDIGFEAVRQMEDIKRAATPEEIQAARYQADIINQTPIIFLRCIIINRKIHMIVSCVFFAAPL